VYAEMKKVVWPTWHQLLTYTGVVLVVVLGFAIVFGIIDLGLERIFRLIIS
jgi:preprotein translocase subunit SecE